METIVLGGGCFWCLEATYQLVRGVEKVVPGYAGGATSNPTYENLGDHAEVVSIVFDPSVITTDEILDIFWAIHDPTTPNRQGNDVGSQYRSVILYKTNQQKAVAQASVKSAQKLWDDPIVTEVKQLDEFYEAEDYHHNYFQTHPEQAYCQLVINPKLAKLRQKFPTKLK